MGLVVLGSAGREEDETGPDLIDWDIIINI